MDYRCVFLAQIPEEGLAINNRFDACDLFDDEDGVQVAEAIHFKGMIREVSHRYLLSGRITTRLNLVCDRCLKEIQYPVDQGIIVHFAVRSDTARTAERADS
ncbi:hypothetical protein JXA80_08840, partial [bacterium]|nr:hypothetical protein [candidate division CSSED10-310 bacterium]